MIITIVTVVRTVRILILLLILIAILIIIIITVMATMTIILSLINKMNRVLQNQKPKINHGPYPTDTTHINVTSLLLPSTCPFIQSFDTNR